MGVDPKAGAIAALSAVLLGGGYVLYKVVKGEEIRVSPKDLDDILNRGLTSDDKSFEDVHGYDEDDTDQNEICGDDGRIVFP